MTLNERYYAINTVINTYMIGKKISCPVYKYGIDIATLMKDSMNTTGIKYPYFQTAIVPGSVVEQPWTSESSGIVTDFDYQLSFFTAPKDAEYVNDVKFYYPFEVAKNVLGDVNLNILDGIADVKAKEGPYKYEIKSGQTVLTAVMVYKMRAVCSYEAITPPAGETTNLDAAVKVIAQ